MSRKLLFVIGVSVVALFLPSGDACTPPILSQVVGPVFGEIGVMEDEMPLLATTENLDLLGGRLTLHKSNGGKPQDINVTLNLASGAVTAGWPGAAENITIPPRLLDDPTGGYTLTLNNITATLTHQNLTAHEPIEIELYAPDYARSARHSLYFFVSWKLERAYIFYVTEIDCSVAKAVNYISCEESPRAIFEEFWVTIVDVTDGSYFFQPFGKGFGVFLLNPGPSNSLTAVYEDIQVATVSPAWGGCGSGGYIFYDIDSVVDMKRFGKGLLHSLLAVDDPRALSAYTIQQNTEFVSIVNESLPTMYVTEFAVSQISVVTGGVIRFVKLDISDLYSLSDFDPADLEMSTSMSPTPAATSSPTALLPSRAPTSGSPPNSATQAPSLIMSSLLGEASTLSGTKTTSEPSSCPSASPVSPPIPVAGGQGFTPSPSLVGAGFSPTAHPSIFRPIGLPTIQIAGGLEFPSPVSMLQIPPSPPPTTLTSLSPLDSTTAQIFPTQGPKPSLSPTVASAPIFVSTRFPSVPPTNEPTTTQTSPPPTLEPTELSSSPPTELPTNGPTELPSSTPTDLPTNEPTELPSVRPSLIPTGTPSLLVSDAPSYEPTSFPSQPPSESPSYSPTKRPSMDPTVHPTFDPTHHPTTSPVLPTKPPLSIPEGFLLLTAQPIGSFRTESSSLTEDADFQSDSYPVPAPTVTIPTSAVTMIQSPGVLSILTTKPVAKLSEPPSNPVTSYFFQTDPSPNAAQSKEEVATYPSRGPLIRLTTAYAPSTSPKEEVALAPSRGPLLRFTTTYSPSTSPFPPTAQPSHSPLVSTYRTAIVDRNDQTSGGRRANCIFFAMRVSVGLLLFFEFT